MSAWREEVRVQARLALPVVFVQVGMMAMGFVDIAFVGRVSAKDLTGVSLGNTWTFAFLVGGLGILAALDPVVSQAFGARDETAIRRAVQRGCLLALALSVPLGLAIWPAETALTWLGQPEEVVPLASRYSRIIVASVVPFLLFAALRQCLQALHRLRPIVLCIVLSNALNVFLDWVLIGGHLGFPALGAIGSAWATVVSRFAMAGSLAVLGWPVLAPYLRGLDPEVLRLRPLRRMAKLGLPVGAQFAFEVGAFSFIAVLMGRLGAIELAGHQVAMSLASASFMVPLGISMAGSVRVGRAIGAADLPAMRRSAGVSLVAGAGVMLVFGSLFLLLPGPLARLLTDLPEVLEVALVLIPIAGLFQVFDGTQVVAIGVLRGMADTRVPMWIHLVGFWGVGVPLGSGLAFWGGHGPAGLWWGLVGGLGSVALVQLARVRVLLRRDVRRVHIDDEPAVATPLDG